MFIITTHMRSFIMSKLSSKREARYKSTFAPVRWYPRRYRRIYRWILVERYSEQRKICSQLWVNMNLVIFGSGVAAVRRMVEYMARFGFKTNMLGRNRERSRLLHFSI
jgi:hypothetical protein